MPELLHSPVFIAAAALAHAALLVCYARGMRDPAGVAAIMDPAHRARMATTEIAARQEQIVVLAQVRRAAVRELRTEGALTQRAVAAALGISQARVNQMEGPAKAP